MWGQHVRERVTPWTGPGGDATNHAGPDRSGFPFLPPCFEVTLGPHLQRRFLSPFWASDSDGSSLSWRPTLGGPDPETCAPASSWAIGARCEERAMVPQATPALELFGICKWGPTGQGEGSIAAWEETNFDLVYFHLAPFN